jgi:protocatechuate 3,4-dioxygenase, beta subunit
MKSFLKNAFVLFIIITLHVSCGNSQQNPPSTPELVGPCEGCEAIFEYGEKILKSMDTLTGFEDSDEKLKIYGTIFMPDGKTPATDVILYVYHTNSDGIYPTQGDETNWGRRHGFIRGWIKTDDAGSYSFYTSRPGAYPGWTEPAHIHAIILQNDGKYYWIEEYIFDDDALVLDKHRNNENPRGGHSGVVKLQKENGIWVGKRDIILEKNILN